MGEVRHGALVGWRKTGMPSEYMTYFGMLARCGNPNHSAYPRYGGRGIRVCLRWKKSFANFISDMGLKPFPNWSLERKNNDVGYEPGNCIWTDQRSQCRNTRRNSLIEFNGETHCAAEWEEITGVPQKLISERKRRGFTPELCLAPRVLKSRGPGGTFQKVA